MSSGLHESVAGAPSSPGFGQHPCLRYDPQNGVVHATRLITGMREPSDLAKAMQAKGVRATLSSDGKDVILPRDGPTIPILTFGRNCIECNGGCSQPPVALLLEHHCSWPARVRAYA